MRDREILEHVHLVAFHRELIQRHVDGDAILARPARGTVVIGREPGRVEHTLNGQVAHTVDAKEVSNLIDVPVVGQQLFLGGEIDTIVARVSDGRATDTHVDLFGARPREGCLILPRVVVPRTIESSTTTTRLPATTSWITASFSLTANSRSFCSGEMNVRPDVVAAHKAHVKRDAALFGVAHRRGGP